MSHTACLQSSGKASLKILLLFFGSSRLKLVLSGRLTSHFSADAARHPNNGAKHLYRHRGLAFGVFGAAGAGPCFCFPSIWAICGAFPSIPPGRSSSTVLMFNSRRGRNSKICLFRPEEWKCRQTGAYNTLWQTGELPSFLHQPPALIFFPHF